MNINGIECDLNIYYMLYIWFLFDNSNNNLLKPGNLFFDIIIVLIIETINRIEMVNIRKLKSDTVLLFCVVIIVNDINWTLSNMCRLANGRLWDMLGTQESIFVLKHIKILYWFPNLDYNDEMTQILR